MRGDGSDMMIEIDVSEHYQDLVSIERLHEAVAAVLKAEDAAGDVTVVITDNETVAALNRRFLGRDGPTDVLSFPAEDTANAFTLPPGTGHYLGDIVIACPYVIAQAQRQGNDLAEELELLAVHGALHLLGYDHADPEEKAIMWAKQDAILHLLRAS